MATATKTARTLQASASNGAGATATGTAVDLRTAVGDALVTALVTNGATGPALPCQFIVQVSNDPAFKTDVRTIFNNDDDNKSGFGAGRDFHALEALQCMVEHRQGGETGVKSVQLLEGDAAWKAVDAGRFSKQLLLSALSRSDTPLGLTETDGRPQNLVASGQLRVLATKPAAYFVEYLDGLKATVLMLDGAIRDFNFAARLKGVEALQSTQFLLTPEPIATHSACLMNMLEQMIATGAAPYPVERVLLAGGVLESGLASREQHQVRLQTPHLKLAYQPPRKSHFAQA